jgi:CheY-like chemotaxis protein
MATKPGPNRSPRLAGVRVLIVDDDRECLELITTLLSLHGAIVMAAASARAALAILQRVRPHVLLSDVTMPTEDGYWLIKSIRALSVARGGATPAAAVTGLPHDHRAQLLRAGFQSHVTKPFDPGHLVGVVEALALNG